MKERLKKVLKAYIKYFAFNFYKILFYFVLITYIHLKLKIDLISSFQKILTFYIGYMSIYFFNDYIDRNRDLKRKIIDSNKLVLEKKELIFFGLTHLIVFLIISLFLREPIGIILTLINILIGIFRSFILNKDLREISLVILSFLKLYTIYYFVYNIINLDLFIFSFFIYVSLIYSAFYYLHKYYFDKELEILRKTIYLYIYLIFAIILSIYAFLKLENIPISAFTISYYVSMVYFINTYKKIVKNNEDFIKLISLGSLIGMFLLVIFILIRFFFLTKF